MTDRIVMAIRGPSPADAVRQMPHGHHEHRRAEDDQSERAALTEPGRISLFMGEFRHEEEKTVQDALGDRKNQEQHQDRSRNRTKRAQGRQE